LAKLQSSNIESEALKAALDATAKKRGSANVIKNYREIMETVGKSEIMQRQWRNYQKDFEYAVGIEFTDVCEVVVGLMQVMYC
jgi:poly-D-alanine transfer protein DltD